jgi:peptidyl-prolyl cis-trans isomerase C
LKLVTGSKLRVRIPSPLASLNQAIWSLSPNFSLPLKTICKDAKRRMITKPVQGLILILLLFLSGCGLADRVRNLLNPDDSGSVAVRVGQKKFSKANLQRFFDTRLSDFRDPARADKVKSNLLESFIDEKLLLHQAERLKINPDPQMLKSMMDRISESDGNRQDSGRDPELERSLSENLRVQRYLHDFLFKDVFVSEKECEDFYQEHLAEYIRNDEVHLREILVDDLNQAQKILAALKASQNKNFSELARLYSKAPGAVDGGELGSFQRGELPEVFEKAVFHLAPATTSKIVQTQYGFHIFLVDERILAHQQRFYEVREQIHEKLRLERERGILNTELQSLMNQIKVEIHRDKLDFNYLGTRFPTRGGNTP